MTCSELTSKSPTIIFYPDPFINMMIRHVNIFKHFAQLRTVVTVLKIFVSTLRKLINTDKVHDLCRPTVKLGESNGYSAVAQHSR